MKKAIVVVGMVAMFAGCAFNPESMPIGQKDSTVYVDAGAPKKLATQESKAKVSVIVSLGKFKKAGESLDSFLNARLAGFSFFQVVDRKSQALAWHRLMRRVRQFRAKPYSISNGSIRRQRGLS